MKCLNPSCAKEFEPFQEARLGSHDGNAVEVKTECPNCGAAYYDFTSGMWICDHQTTTTK